MLRVLSRTFFAAVILEAVLVATGTLQPVPGLGAMAVGLFFGGVLHGMEQLHRELGAIRTRLMEPGSGTVPPALPDAPAAPRTIR